MSDEQERKVQAGELEKVQAAEEVTRRNVTAVIQHANETRKMVLELKLMVDTLQNNMLNLKKLHDQQRHQLALLQQQFYQRGTTSYADGD
jgi:hypothetical protein